jgi:hypothetical protein
MAFAQGGQSEAAIIARVGEVADPYASGVEQAYYRSNNLFTRDAA